MTPPPEKISGRTAALMMAGLFCLWVALMFPFLTGSIDITGDAIAYYNHTKFYITYLRQGMIPLWDHFLNFGVPNEFFLRRLGAYNPLYFVMAVLSFLPVPFITIYLISLFGYFLLGLTGFYALAHILTRSRFWSLMGFALLLMSTLGTRIIDSYIILIFVPMIWFFFFFCAFFRQPRTDRLLGLTLTAMILLTTYIPFFFLTIFLTFIILFFMIYFRDLPELTGRAFSYIRSRRWIVITCLVLITASIYPGYRFMQESRTGEFTLAEKSDRKEKSLEVKAQTLSGGGVVLAVDHNHLFRLPDNHPAGHPSIPLYSFVLLFLACFTKINRAGFLMLLWAFSIFIISLNEATPIYPFLYEHIFFFRYFRNFFFFLWIFLLPLSILFAIYQAPSFINQLKNIKSRPLAWTYSAFIHTACGICLVFFKAPLIVTLVTVGAGFFLHSVIFPKTNRYPIIYLIGIFLIVLLHPLGIYKNFLQYPEWTSRKYVYDRPFTIFRHHKFDFPGKSPTSEIPLPYYSTSRFMDFVRSVPPDIYRDYLSHKLYLYSSTTMLKPWSWKDFARSYREHPERAVVETETGFTNPQSSFARRPALPGDGSLVVERFSPNLVVFKTSFTNPTFLVYNDNHHSGWKARIDGKPAKILRTHGTFKGLWVPAGEQTVQLRFGSALDQFLNYGFIIVFYGLAVLTIVSRPRKKPELPT